MTEEKLGELNELQGKIKICEVRLDAIKEYKEFNGRNISIGSSDYGVPIPDELRNVSLTLLEDYYTRKLNGLKEEFKEG